MSWCGLLGLCVGGALATAHAPVVEQALACCRSFKQGLDASQQRDCRNICGAVGGNHHDGIALLEVRNFNNRRAAEHLLWIAAACSASGLALPLACSARCTTRLSSGL